VLPAALPGQFSGTRPRRPVCALEIQLHLNRGLFDQYWIWLSGVFTGNLGHSLAKRHPGVDLRFATPAELGLPRTRHRHDRLSHRRDVGRGSQSCARMAGSITAPQLFRSQ